MKPIHPEQASEPKHVRRAAARPSPTPDEPARMPTDRVGNRAVLDLLQGNRPAKGRGMCVECAERSAQAR